MNMLTLAIGGFILGMIYLVGLMFYFALGEVEEDNYDNKN